MRLMRLDTFPQVLASRAPVDDLAEDLPPDPDDWHDLRHAAEVDRLARLAWLRAPSVRYASLGLTLCGLAWWLGR